MKGAIIMEKSIFEQMGGTYEVQSDYRLPCLTLPVADKSVGIWGQRHLRYIKKYRKILYVTLLTDGKLNAYLADVDRQAEELFFRLVKEYAERQGITEQLKAENQMDWVRRMNNCRALVEEVIRAEIIYD